jgi:hypothetical protein
MALKGHLSVDPDSEIVTATTVTPGNASDGSVATGLIDDLLGDDHSDGDGDGDESSADEATDVVVPDSTDTEATGDDTATVYGDSAYGTGGIQSRLEDEGIESKCKTQQPSARIGFFAKDRFVVNLEDDTVTCPNGVTVTIRRHVKGRAVPNHRVSPEGERSQPSPDSSPLGRISPSPFPYGQPSTK